MFLSLKNLMKQDFVGCIVWCRTTVLLCKRFTSGFAKKVSFLGENPDSKMILLTTEVYPSYWSCVWRQRRRKELAVIDVEEFIEQKVIRLKASEFLQNEVEKIHELEPTRFLNRKKNLKVNRKKQKKQILPKLKLKRLFLIPIQKIEEEKGWQEK